MVEAEAVRREATIDDACAACGIEARTLWGWKTGERATATFNAADRVLTNLGLLPWQVFDDATCERLGYPVF